MDHGGIAHQLPRDPLPGIVAAVLAVLGIWWSLRRSDAPTRGPFTGIPPLSATLAKEPGRVVLVETPFYPGQAVFENAEYVPNSTAHWRPLMNGYSGYTPAS